jgi:hypothetical protein
MEPLVTQNALASSGSNFCERWRTAPGLYLQNGGSSDMPWQIRFLTVVLAILGGGTWHPRLAWAQQKTSGVPISGWRLTGSAPESYEAGWLGGADAAFYLRTRTPPLGGGFGTWMKYGEAAPYVGKRMRLRANIEPKDVSGWAGIWMRVDGKNGKVLQFDNMQSRPVRGTMPPRPYEVVLDVPADAVGLGYGILLAGSGNLRVTDMVLEAVSADVATTSLSPPQDGTWFLAGSMPQKYAAGLTVGAESSSYLRSSSDGPINGFGTWMTTVEAAPYAGKRVRLRGAVATKDVTGSAGLWMRVDGSEKGPGHGGQPATLAFDNMSDRPIKGTTDSKQYDVVLSVPAAAKQIAYGVMLVDHGETHTSDLKLEVVSDTVPLTGNPKR